MVGRARSNRLSQRLVQQVFAADGAKARQVAFPDLSQGAGIGALAEGFVDFLIGEQAIESIGGKILRI